MAGPVSYDRVMETTPTTGTGALALAGAVAGFESFAVVGDGNTCPYAAWAVDENGVPTGDWETGVGTYAASGTTLARSVLQSSNGNALVAFAAGTKRVAITPLADLTVQCDANPGTTGQVLTSRGTGLLPRWAAPALGPTDGDKGDVIVSASGATWTIDANVVSDAKFRQSAGLSVVGRAANTTGNVADVVAASDGQVLHRNGSIIEFGAVNLGGVNAVTGVAATINGGTGQSGLTAYAVVCGGTTAFGAAQQVSGLGAAGTVLTSNGAAALPTWQSAAGALTTRGDMLFRNSVTAARLPIGSADQFLRVDSSGLEPQWRDDARIVSLSFSGMTGVSAPTSSVSGTGGGLNAAFAWDTQNPRLFLAGPAGILSPPAAPTWRLLDPADLPDVVGVSGAWGSATEIPIVTFDSHGVLQSVTTATVDLVALGGLTVFDIGNTVQAWDIGLDALAAFNTNGVICQTAQDVYAGRTLTGTANRLTVTNGDGVSGNPTFDVSTSYAGQATITTLGTVTTGTWNGTAIANAYLANSSLTVTAGTGLTGGGSVSLGGTTTLTVAYGTSASTACVGNDARLSDARTPVGTALTSAKIWVGDSGNLAAAVAVSGDVTIDNAGATTIGAGKVTNAMLAGSIANGKLANSSVTVTAGTGLTGGGSVALGATITLTVAYGTSSSTACVGNDSRLSDARTPVGTALTATNIWVGNGSNVAAAVALSGDATLSNAGALTIANDAVTYAKIQNVSATSRFLGRITSGAGDVEELTAANAKTILALTSSDVSLGNVTNDAQTKAAIVPNTAPSAGQILAGNAGGTAYAPQTLSGSGATFTLSSAGVLTVSAVANASLSNSSVTISGHSLSLGGTLNLVSSDVSLGSVTNDAQTKAAVVPNTAPSAGQILVGNAGGTAYAPVTLSGSGATFTLSSAGVLTVSAVANASLSNSSVTVTAGTGLTGGGSVALGATITLTVAYGTSSTTACVGNDSRLSDARTPVGTALTSAKVWVGDGSNLAAAVAVTGDVTITNAGVTAIGAGKVTDTMLALAPHVAEGRLTLTSGTAVTTSDVTAATSVYYAIYQGNQITLYDGSVSKRVTFTEQTLSLSGLTVGRTYDVFGYISSGVLAIEALGWTAPATAALTNATNATPIVITSNGHGLANGQLVTITGVVGNTAANGTFRVAAVATNTFSLNTEAGASVAGSGGYTSGGTWTRVDQATSRATALTTQDGYLVKTGDATRRYLGTFRITRTAGQTEDSAQRRLVWNCYNRCLRKLKKVESTVSWTTTSATFLCANGTTANRLEIVVGLVEDVVHLHVSVYTNNSTTNADYASVGINSITTSDADLVAVTAGASTTFAPAVATLDHIPDVGYTFYQWTESTGGGTATFFGTTGFIRGGISGFING